MNIKKQETCDVCFAMDTVMEWMEQFNRPIYIHIHPESLYCLSDCIYTFSVATNDSQHKPAHLYIRIEFIVSGWIWSIVSGILLINNLK